MNYQIHTIDHNFQVKITSQAPFNLTDEIVHQVDELWGKAKKKRGDSLFNGQFLNYVSYKDNELIGNFCEYKYYIAQLADLSLKRKLNLHPVALSGVTLAQNRCLVGKRSLNLTNYPGCLELVPSGGIEPKFVMDNQIDYIGQVLLELKEETGILIDQVLSTTPFYLIYDSLSKMHEICVEIKLKELPKLTTNGNEEYSELYWENNLFECKQKFEEKNVVPFSSLLLKKYLKWTGMDEVDGMDKNGRDGQG